LNRFQVSYEWWFIEHSKFVGFIASTVRWYNFLLLPDRFGKNELKTIVLNTILECLTCYHDYVWLKHADLLSRRKIVVEEPVRSQLENAPYFPKSNLNIASTLTIIDHTELLCEILATNVQEHFSNPLLRNLKWNVITLIEATKAYLRLKLLVAERGAILAHRTIPSRYVEEEQNGDDDFVDVDQQRYSDGRTVRQNLLIVQRAVNKKKGNDAREGRQATH